MNYFSYQPYFAFASGVTESLLFLFFLGGWPKRGRPSPGGWGVRGRHCNEGRTIKSQMGGHGVKRRGGACPPDPHSYATGLCVLTEISKFR